MSLKSIGKSNKCLLKNLHRTSEKIGQHIRDLLFWNSLRWRLARICLQSTVVTERPLHSLPTKLRQGSKNHPVLMWVCKVEIRWLKDSEITAGSMPKFCGSQIHLVRWCTYSKWCISMAMLNNQRVPFWSILSVYDLLLSSLNSSSFCWLRHLQSTTDNVPLKNRNRESLSN